MPVLLADMKSLMYMYLSVAKYLMALPHPHKISHLYDTVATHLNAVLFADMK